MRPVLGPPRDGVRILGAAFVLAGSVVAPGWRWSTDRQMKRWAGFGLVVLIAAGACARAGAQAMVTVSDCGFGPPPGSPDFAARKARHAAEVRERGYESVCESYFQPGERPWRSGPLEDAKLAFQPLDLAHTPFAGFDGEGYDVDSINHKNTMLYRRFALPDGHHLVLFEHDMSADGSQALLDPIDEPGHIGGLKGHLIIMQAPSGKAMSLLVWVEGRRMVSLETDTNVGTAGPARERLIALATSLPASIPACRHEPPLDPMVIGPDGMLVSAWSQKASTQADFDRARERSEHPCLD